MKTQLQPDPMSLHNAVSRDLRNAPPASRAPKPAAGSGWAHACLPLATALFLAAPLGSPLSAVAQNASPPDLLSYQGFLVDGAGQPLAPTAPENFVVVFRIFDTPDGGTSLWSEEQVVTVDQGNFSVALGEGAAHSGEPRGTLGDVFNGNTASDRYLQTSVTINGTLETLLPRLRLVPSAYSFLAAKAVSAGSALGVQTPEGAGFTSSGGGSLELGPDSGGNGAPYIGFRDGNQQSGNYSVRLVNDATGQLSLEGDLAVTGKVDAGEFLLNGAPLRTSPWQSSGQDIYFDGGNVGVGRTDPGSNRLQLGTWWHENGNQPEQYGLVVANGGNNGVAIQIARNLGEGGYGLLVDNFGYGDTSTDLLLVRNNTDPRTGGGGPNIALNVKAQSGGASYVGIGQAATTTANLAVNGIVDAKEYRINGGPLPSSAWQTSGSALAYNGGNVSIGGGNLGVSGALGVAGNISGGSAGISGNATVNGTLDAGTANISGTLGADVLSARRADIQTINVGSDGLYQNIGGTLYSLRKRNTDTVAVWQNSDSRLKREIETIPSAIETVSRLRGVTWHWNDLGLEQFTADVERDFRSPSGRPEDDERIWEEKRAEILEEQSKRQYGFVAQEVEQIFPDWVSTGENGYKQINMERLSAVLVEAIKEQQADLEAKAAKIESLEKRLATLEARDRARTAEFATLESLVRERLGVVHQASLRVNQAVNND
ncbi:MAG: tail fiber domain-containing protein [Verrucomicrobiales bacterium]|nr:tail fiber domain-containing protein [Verrucomicrobiales bacterium]